MENQTLSLHELLNLMDDDCLLLTANSRQRRFLLKHLSELKGIQAHADDRINPERLLSFNQWLDDSWQQLQNKAYSKAAKLLISPQQNLTLWQQVIDQSEESAKLICPELLAKQASSAWQLLAEWNIPADALSEYTHQESEILQMWGQEFTQLCSTLSLIDAAQQCHITKQAFSEGTLDRYSKVIMLGFDDLSPLRMGLCEALAQECNFVQLKHFEDNDSFILECDDAEDEIRRCARYIRHELEQAQINEEKAPRIGVIDPQLGQRRDLIERIFCEELEPQFIHSKTARYTLPFNFSAGFPLASCPLIDTALALLSLNQQKLDVERLCLLLHSPFWHLNADLDKPALIAERCQLEYQLRDLQQSQIRPAQFRQCADKVAKKLADQFDLLSDKASNSDNLAPADNDDQLRAQTQTIAERLELIFQAQQRRPDRNSAKQWSQIFYQQLESLNWPGCRRLDSNEYQQVMQFQGLLENLLSLDHLNQLYSASELLSQLQQLASSHHFQAKTPDSPIQILGMLEGAGQAFDCCWVLGMEQKQWPPSPQANPLLPIELQRQHNMPHASAERELFFANQLTQSYQLCAPKVIFSHPSRAGEEQLQCSPLVENSGTTLSYRDASESLIKQTQPGANTPTINSYSEQCFDRRQFQWVDNRQGPNLSKSEKKLGGSGVLKQQALCPFNAFAQHRLGAKPWPEVQIGISAIERGNILHLALETFWGQVKNQDTLLSLSEIELTESIRQHISDAIEQCLMRRRDLGPRFRQLEAERIFPLIEAFINVDKERSNFIVDGIESSYELKLGPLRLQLRLDRLDKLINLNSSQEDESASNVITADDNTTEMNKLRDDDHQYVVIDYKTGQCDVKSWLGSRPDEPQLPLYSLSDDRICAITFAQLNAKSVNYAGISAAPLTLPGVQAIEDESLLKKIKQQDSRFSMIEDSLTWSNLRQQWHNDLLALAIDYAQGHAELDFKDPLAKRYSEDLAGVQRLKEFDSKRRYWNENPAQLQQTQFDLSL